MPIIKNDITIKSIYSMSDVTLSFLFAGAITFLIGFTGCVGALRENTALLAAYAIFLAILLLLEMTAGILGFIFKDWVICSTLIQYLIHFSPLLKEVLITYHNSQSIKYFKKSINVFFLLDKRSSDKWLPSFYCTLSRRSGPTEFNRLDSRRMGKLN